MITDEQIYFSMPSVDREWCGWLTYIWDAYGTQNFAQATH